MKRQRNGNIGNSPKSSRHLGGGGGLKLVQMMKASGHQSTLQFF